MAINFGNIGNIGSYETYATNMVSNLVQMITEDDKTGLKKNNIDAMDYFKSYSGKSKICICPEPITFLKKITREDTSIKRQETFLGYVKQIDSIDVERQQANIWFNKSSNGINIRLGNIEKDTGNQEPATLGDDCVHGVVVGRTGAGKSVLINNIILNLITEYSPWELDLYLVDMKKVELSRYMKNDETDGRYMTPHVSACGATSEVRYVVSMIQYLSDCMKARQSLFAALGVQKIKDFREKYSKELGVDFVLPRILLLVDEFQQMFLEASNRERKILDECITAITKLGRATGVHLLFASQEMSGALGSKELANFKLRIALPCDATISEQILGNSAAAKLEKKGITLVNKKGGSKEEDNIEYNTPFVNDKEEEDGSPSEFARYLLKIHEASRNSKYTKVQKFYQEDTQEKIEKIEKIRRSENISRQIKMLMENNAAIIDAFILGSGVLYTNKKNDFESFFIEKGKKRNIGILCAKDGDIGTTIKTLVDNFRFSEVEYEHSVIYESEVLRSVYPEMINDLNSEKICAKEYGYQEYFLKDGMNYNQILYSMDFSRSVREIMISFLILPLQDMKKKDMEQYLNSDSIKYLNDKNIVEQVEKIFAEMPELEDKPFEAVFDYLVEKIIKIEEETNQLRKSEDEAKERKLNNLNAELPIVQILLTLMSRFSEKNPRIVERDIKLRKIICDSIVAKKLKKPIKVTWIIGTDNIDKSEDKLLTSIMENCSNMGEIYILAGSNPENLENAFRCCNYMFVNSPDERMYTKYKMSFTKKSDDNKTMEFKIINYNQERSYKQFSYDCKMEDAPRLDFEEIEV